MEGLYTVTWTCLELSVFCWVTWLPLASPGRCVHFTHIRESRFSFSNSWHRIRAFSKSVSSICCLTSQRRREVALAEDHGVRISSSKGYFYIRCVSPEGLKGAAPEETTASFFSSEFWSHAIVHRSWGWSSSYLYPRFCQLQAGSLSLEVYA